MISFDEKGQAALLLFTSGQKTKEKTRLSNKTHCVVDNVSFDITLTVMLQTLQ